MKKKANKKEFHSVDSPPVSTEMIKKMQPSRELFPDIPRFITKGPQKASTKTKVSIHLSSQVVEYFKSKGEGWQARVDEALLEYMNSH